MKDFPCTNSTQECSHASPADLIEAPAKSKRGRKKSTAPKSLKKEKRLIQNRESAFRFRIKRKTEFETLRQQVDELIEENEGLKQQVAQLKQIIASGQFDKSASPVVKSEVKPISAPVQQVGVEAQNLMAQLSKIQGEINQIQQVSGVLQSQKQQLLIGQPVHVNQTNHHSHATSTVASSHSASPILKTQDSVQTPPHNMFANLPSTAAQQLAGVLHAPTPRVINPVYMKQMIQNQPQLIAHNSFSSATNAQQQYWTNNAPQMHSQITQQQHMLSSMHHGQAVQGGLFKLPMGAPFFPPHHQAHPSMLQQRLVQ
ncbi:hypothetical protein FGO68_gene13627 [Halteria grandinella]|uniref:BZIP domain-containing protein n=1 Tax=Halteria grandinella TaxID=5974 RepID=A0A8J8NSH3_HALGN|nr:hypothetical protein FGO68_gene13627 [Halteria grandinella]